MTQSESALQELRNAVMREVSLDYPIVYDCYNIFEIDTSHVKVKRKKP